MDPTPAVAVLMPQAVVGCLGGEGGVKASLVGPSCSWLSIHFWRRWWSDQGQLGEGKTSLGHLQFGSWLSHPQSVHPLHL